MSWTSWILLSIAILIGYQFFAWFNTKRLCAINVVHAALTYRTLDAGGAGGVDGQVANICRRLGIDTELLGESFPFNSTSTKGVVESPAIVYAFRSIAMNELGISPSDSDLSRWYVLRNPFNAALAQKAIAKYRKRYEQKYGITLGELDSI
jgi:hypothetical protein